MVQHSLGMARTSRRSYLGALGRELPNCLDLNLNPTTTALVQCRTSRLPFPTPPGKVRCPTEQPTRCQPTQPMATPPSSAPMRHNFQAITELISNINSNYNAMVLEILNRSLHSIQFDVNYTWSHALDFAQQAQHHLCGST